MVYGHGKVGRNVSISHCYGYRCIDTNLDPPDYDDFSIDIYGNYTPDRATRFSRRLTSDTSIVINNVEIETHYYAMDLETFMKHSERTN